MATLKPILTEQEIIRTVLKKRVYQSVFEQMSKTNRTTAGALSQVPGKEERN